MQLSHLYNSQSCYTYFLFSTVAQLIIIIFSWSFDCKFLCSGYWTKKKEKIYQNKFIRFFSLCKQKMSRVFPRCFFVLDIYVMGVVGFLYMCVCMLLYLAIFRVYGLFLFQTEFWRKKSRLLFPNNRRLGGSRKYNPFHHIYEEKRILIYIANVFHMEHIWII